MTRQEIREMSRKKLGESTTSFWTDTEINNYINAGCKDVSWRTKCLRTNGTIQAVSCSSSTVSLKSNEYTISSSFPTCYAINEVYFKQEDETFERLIPSSREELDALNPAWMSLVGYSTISTAGVTTYNYGSSGGTPTHYYWSREEDVLGLYPPPDSTQDGADIKCYYSYTHTDLSSDSASPTLPVPLHLAVVDFVVASGLEDRGWGDRANDMWGKYYAKIKDYTVEKKNEREDDEIISKNYRNI